MCDCFDQVCATSANSKSRNLLKMDEKTNLTIIRNNPSITDGVHRTENFVEIIPVFSTFSNFFKQTKKKV